ncbi:MAG: glycoside hydrolase family 3 N-terminal domain-containing protein [Hyphomicrobium sp.]|nr:glycoside hydrolase family 3 N-terminal domain-containing protein [Hyphomicrobium sp.]
MRAFLLLLLSLLMIPPAHAAATRSAKAIEADVERLLGRMTLEEKVGQLNFPSLGFPHAPQIEDVKRGRIGAMLNVVDPRYIREIGLAARQSRLKIPMLFAIDAIYALKITFPPPLAWAATWRPELARAATREIARETAALGVNWTFAPMVDISRDPRWGRVIEGAGEDPFLASAFSAARVAGYRDGGLATSVKHFVGYGAPEGGRDYNGAEISVPELHDRYLPPFKAALDAGSEIVMASFNTINGVPVTADRRLVRGLLKDRLGFDGIVTSDFVAIGELVNHGVAADLAEATRKAILAGIDLDMAGGAYDQHLAAEVKAGRVAQKLVDDAVRRVLRVKYRLGLFDLPEDYFDRLPQTVGEGEVRATARQVARESFVLVKNDKATLPISPSVRSIALIGANAVSVNDHSWYGPAGYGKPDTVTLKAALDARLRPGQRLVYEPAFADPCGRSYAGRDAALAAARQADLVVFSAIEDCEIQGEGVSRTDLGLSGVQQDLMEALVKTGKPVVLVVETGRPLALSHADTYAAAILVAWHPGTEGRTALAEVLTGEVSPSGKLPMTFPRSVGQIPIAYNHLPTSRPWTGSRYTSGYIDSDPSPLYPFGHGLGYTDFAYEALRLDRPVMARDGEIEVAVKVRNAGARSGSEVVQLYTRQLVASRSRPVKELKGFQKIDLAPRETKVVRFTLKARDLGFHDDDGLLKVEAGPFKVFAGGSSMTALEADFRVVE